MNPRFLVKVRKKQCNDCKREGMGPKPVDQFYVCSASPDGYGYKCKSHLSAYYKDRYRSGKVKVFDRMAKRISKETGIVYETVHTVLDHVRNMPHHSGGVRQISKALKGWKSASCA